jgi:protein-tyrosine-phosphatase
MSDEPAPSGRGPQLLVVCTANQCRSPMGEALVRDALGRRGITGAVASAGFLPGGFAAAGGAIDAMRRTGLDISGHTSRRLDAAILDWADIVITMEGAHVVDLVEEWPDHARWAVTMEGAVRVAETHEPTGTLDGPGIRDWATAAQTLLVPSILDQRDDVADPMGRSNREFRRTAELLADRISRLLDVWFPTTAAR